MHNTHYIQKGLGSLHCGNSDMASKEPTCLTRKSIRQVGSILILVYLQEDERDSIAGSQIMYLEIWNIFLE